MEDWKRAISLKDFAYDVELETWLAGQARELGSDRCEALAQGLMPDLSGYPVLAGVIARVLLDSHRWATCDRLLGRVAEKSPELSALWAELALGMGDVHAARIRARAAWEMDVSSARWSAWYGQFQERLKRRQ